MRNTSTVVITGLLIVLLVVMLAGLAFVASGSGAMMSGYMMGGAMMPRFGFGAGYMIVGQFLWALVIGGSILSVIWFVQRAGASTSNKAGQQTALEILKMRFARGEITREQFEDMQRAVRV